MKEIFVIDGVRTPIGSPYRGLKNFSAVQLAAIVIKEIASRNKLGNDLIDEGVIGNTVSSGLGQNLSRQAFFLAGFPDVVPTFSINNVCGSGMQSIILGIQSILSENASLIIGGGTESATHCPKISFEDKKKRVDSLVYDGLWCHLTNKHMGELCEDLAEKFLISREEQDKYAFNSYVKACNAQTQGKFQKEIVPIKKKQGDRFFREDEHLRKNIKLEKLLTLSPAFRKKGTITAGNSSAPCDGASMIALASRKAIQRNKLFPRARVLGYASVAVPPKEVFTAGVVSIKECLRKSGLSLKEIDLFEISEAFAAQAIFTQKQLNIPYDKMNIFGGDIALGHPLGAVGTRILVTLIYALIDQKKKKGLACVCLGGGGAVAMIVERVS